MCDCGNNIIDLSHLKIYTVMAEYKSKLSSGTTHKNGFKISWATATQEELAYAYEDLGMTDKVEKLSDGNKVSTLEAAQLKKSLQKIRNKKQILKEKDNKGMLSEKNIKPQE